MDPHFYRREPDEFDPDPEEMAEIIAAERAFWASPTRRPCRPEVHIDMPWKTISCVEKFPTYDDIPF